MPLARVEPVAWTQADSVRWARIALHDFEPADVALTFTHRLARDHGWSLAWARGAINEYRRFCFLALCADCELTPSEEVDEVWHQHLTDSRDYWEVWCSRVLGRYLHHQPTQGSPQESRRFSEQYASTLAAYEAWFGPPPATFWPGTSERFSGVPRFRIVDLDASLVIPVPRILACKLRKRSG